MFPTQFKTDGPPRRAHQGISRVHGHRGTIPHYPRPNPSGGGDRRGRWVVDQSDDVISNVIWMASSLTPLAHQLSTGGGGATTAILGVGSGDAAAAGPAHAAHGTKPPDGAADRRPHRRGARAAAGAWGLIGWMRAMRSQCGPLSTLPVPTHHLTHPAPPLPATGRHHRRVLPPLRQQLPRPPPPPPRPAPARRKPRPLPPPLLAPRRRRRLHRLPHEREARQVPGAAGGGPRGAQRRAVHRATEGAFGRSTTMGRVVAGAE